MKQLMLVLLVVLGHFMISGAENLLNRPESIIYDSVNDRYLVTNLNTGDIIQIDADGNYSVYYQGLNSTYGMDIVGDSLYVCCNFSAALGIWTFDLTTDQIVSQIQPSRMLLANDLTFDTSGNLYCTDTFGNCIFKIRLNDKYSERILVDEILTPNGVFFDKYDNHLLVASNINGSPVYAVDVNTLEVTAATTFTGEFDHFARDQRNNIYVSHSSLGVVYRFDSSLTGTPEIVASGYLTPEGIIFNQAQSLLCIPVMDEHRIVFLPMDIDIWATTDALVGWVPHTVGLEAGSVYDIESWSWDFGDGQDGVGATISHEYDLPGVYDLNLTGVTTSGDTLTRLYRDYVFCLADTLWANDVDIDPDSEVIVTVFATNTVPVREFNFSAQYEGDLILVLDSISTTECRTMSFENIALMIYSSEKRITAALSTQDPRSPWYMEAGTGPIMKLYFQTTSPIMGQSTEIRLSGNDQADPYFVSNGTEYIPAVHYAEVKYPSCCINTRGNVDGDEADHVVISDITFLVEYLFAAGPEPPCIHEANADGDIVGDALGQLNIADLTYIVDYLFAGGPAPPDCP